MSDDIRIEYMALDDLMTRFHPRNPKAHDIGAIIASIQEFGYIAPGALDEASGLFVEGHGRTEALGVMRRQQMAIPDRIKVGPGGEWMPPVIRGITFKNEAQVLSYIVADNRLTELGGWDDLALASVLQELANDDDTSLLAATGYDTDDIDNLLRDLAMDEEPSPDPGAQVDKAEELREQWQTERGQLWVIPSASGKGEHRILCGDSTDPQDVARLMGGVKAQGAFTSPPYAEQRKAQYGGTPADEYVDWWGGVQLCVRDHLKEDGSFFVNIKAHCEDGERVLYVMDLVLAMRRRWNWRFVDELCWLRRGFPGDFKTRFRNAFEPVYHFATNKHILFNPENVLVESSISRGHSPSKSSWNNQSGSGLPGVDYDSIEARPSNVIDIKKTAYGLLHPAIFPIELPNFFIEAYSDNDDSWYDPFLGSGTTIAACEQTGRVGYGMEISEAYTAVCLQRLADMGLEPRLEAHSGT